MSIDSYYTLFTTVPFGHRILLDRVRSDSSYKTKRSENTAITLQMPFGMCLIENT